MGMGGGGGGGGRVTGNVIYNWFVAPQKGVPNYEIPTLVVINNIANTSRQKKSG